MQETADPLAKYVPTFGTSFSSSLGPQPSPLGSLGSVGGLGAGETPAPVVISSDGVVQPDAPILVVPSSPQPPTFEHPYRWGSPHIAEDAWSTGDDDNEGDAYDSRPTPTYNQEDSDDEQDYSVQRLHKHMAHLKKRQRAVAHSARSNIRGVDSDESSEDNCIGAIAVAREGRGGRMWVEVLDAPPRKMRKMFRLDKEKRVEESKLAAEAAALAAANAAALEESAAAAASQVAAAAPVEEPPAATKPGSMVAGETDPVAEW